MPLYIHLLGIFITIMIAGAFHAMKNKEFEDLDGEVFIGIALVALFWPVVLAFGVLVLFFTGPFFLGYSLYKKLTPKEK